MKKLNKFERQNKLPLGPKKLPFIGNLHQLGDLSHQSLQNLSNQHCPLMFLQLGLISTLVISSADMAREIFKNHDLVFSGRPMLYAAKKMSYDCSNLSFAPYGEYWRQVKIVISELLSARKFQSVRNEEVKFLLDSIAVSSGPVNLSDLTMSLANNIVRQVAFSRRYKDGKLHEMKF
ncbi:Cytochrome P450 [Quillaja saponaria]|uniref:Cytochrome P450 n=1 Tax=Quillaja saponaria TaxID=32244 RepID=A0AAD7KTL2_QUISA|nr:Cytochrome P450 [Quillaja saponaria]KAJ7945790.1 Cytochrome P450 [Quillaja saponaria]